MLFDKIKNRRAISPADFADKPVDKQEILQLLEAANWAPTHRRTEPWRFKIFHEDAAKEKLADFIVKRYEETSVKVSAIGTRIRREKVLQSGAVIAICMQRDPKESVPEWEEIAAVAMAVQNLWLSAQELNLGGYWSSPASMLDIQELTPLAEGEKCLGFFYLGKLNETPEPGTRKTSAEEKTTWM